MSPLRWTCKSSRHLAEALAQQGFTASHRVVGEMLHHLGYSLQANAKTLEGKQHPDRDAQFRYINRTSGRFIAEDSPVISVTNPGWPLAVNKRVQGADIGALWYWASLFKDLWVSE